MFQFIILPHISNTNYWFTEGSILYSDDVHRHASAIAISAIGKNTPDVIRAYASITLPLAFLGMHEVEARKNAGTDTTKYVKPIVHS